MKPASILSACVFLLATAVSASSEGKPGKVPWFEIPGTRRELAAEGLRIRIELAGLPEFSESRQIDAYGFHGDYLPVLDELPEEPRWTVELGWGKIAKLQQVILVPAIDPRVAKMSGYGFPRRFRVWKQFKNGSDELVAEWMDEDFPDPAYVPLRIALSEPWCESIRIEVFRGAKEGDREFFALGEVFGVVEDDFWKAIDITAGPEFESRPYWSKDYLSDQKTGLGMPLGALPEGRQDGERDFSVVFAEAPEDGAFIDFDLGSEKRMGWLTLLPSITQSVVPGYGFPRKIELLIERKVGTRMLFRPAPKTGVYEGNPGDNAVRIPLFGVTGRWLRMKVSDFAEHNGRKIFALGEASISMKDERYPVDRVRLKGFPEEVVPLASALTDGLVGGRPEVQMLEWFGLIEREHALQARLGEIALEDAELERRWAQAQKAGIIGGVSLILLLLAILAVHRQLSLQRLRLRIVEEQHHTEIEQMKLRFFTHISHELRTPLTVIPAPIERAMREVGDGKLRTYLGVALRNVRELQQLVEQILDLRRIQDGKMRINPVQLEMVVQLRAIIESMRPLAEDKAIDLVFEPAEESFMVRLDPEAIKRILGNLIGNAIKYTPSGGRVVVRLSQVRRVLVVSVEDTGSGIAAGDLPHIFEQHYRGQSPATEHIHGSGMGLALVQEIVALLGGSVQVESPVADGLGTRFTVKLPIDKRPEDAG